MYCHCEKVCSFPADGCTISKKSLYCMWYCGDNNPVSKLNTSVTEVACLGDDPRFIPNGALGFHFGILLFACKQLSNA
jgi:hypothetical protein